MLAGRLRWYDTRIRVFSLIVDSFSGCNWAVEDWSCCSSLNPCWLFEGDCDSDDECLGYLICGNNNCVSPFPPKADCCYDPLEGKESFCFQNKNKNKMFLTLEMFITKCLIYIYCLTICQQRRFRSIERGTVSLCKSNGCKVTIHQTWRIIQSSGTRTQATGNWFDSGQVWWTISVQFFDLQRLYWYIVWSRDWQIGFASSKWPHFNSSYVIGVCIFFAMAVC